MPAFFDQLIVSITDTRRSSVTRAGGTTHNIPDMVGTPNARVSGAFPTWSQEVRIAIGALCLEPLRSMGLLMQEYIMILYVIESPERLRAHNGVAVIYGAEGSWLPFSGVVLPTCLFRVKSYMIQPEGLCRRIPGTTQRTEAALLESIDEPFSRSGMPKREVLKGLQRTEQVCVNRPNRRKGNRNRGGVSDDEVPETISTWTEGVRDGKPLPRGCSALLGERLMRYFVQWCGTPKPTRSAMTHASSLMTTE